MMIRPFRGLARAVACSFLAVALPAFAGPDDMIVPGTDTATNTASPDASPLFGPDTVTKQYFGRMPHGGPVSLYTLTNRAGMSVSVMDYGATITAIRVPDKDGKIDGVVLGYDRFAPYLAMKDYFGATVGRYGKPHRARQVYPRQAQLPARDQQRPQRPSRRHLRVQPPHVELRAGRFR